MEKLETILTDCINEIKSGKATLSDCLNRYPSRRRELESLLKLALNIREPSGIKLDRGDKQIIKANLLSQISNSRQQKTKTSASPFSFRFLPQPAWARAAISIIAIVIILSIITGGTAYASQGSLPGDFLYPVKTATEDTRIFFVRGNAARAELNLEFARTRLKEMDRLADADEEKTELALNGYQKNLEAADKHIRSISDPAALSNLLITSIEDVQEQMNLCDMIIDINPRYIEPVKEAGTLNTNEQVALVTILAQHNALQAAQINLNSMQNRLQRADMKAGAGQFQAMQEVLLQYQQFNRIGEQILLSAQAAGEQNVEIETLSSQSLSAFLDIIDNIFRQTPREYQNNIEICRQATQQFQTQARYRYQRRGEPEMNLQWPQSGNSPDSTILQDEGPAVTQDGTSGDDTPVFNNAVSPGTGTSSSSNNETTSEPATDPSRDIDGTAGNVSGQSSDDNPGSGGGTGGEQNTNPPPDSGGNTGNGSGSGSGGEDSGDGQGEGTTSRP